MITEKYDIITQAENIIKQWDNDEFKFSPSATTYSIPGEYWKKEYGKNPTISKAFAYAVSQFHKNKDQYQRVSKLESNFTYEMVKQNCEFGMINFAQDIVSLRNLTKGEDYIQPGEEYQKKLKELEEQVKQEQRARKAAEEQASDAERLVNEKGGIIDQANQKLSKLSEQNEMFVIYGRTLSPKFVEEAEKYCRTKYESSIANASQGDGDNE